MTGAKRGRKPNEARRREIARLRAEGLTYADIGRHVGVSRQGVLRALRRMGRAGTAPVACRQCGAVIRARPPGNRPPRPALCPTCLGKSPEAPFADRLRTFRLAAGLTQGQLAERAGLTEAAVGGYERGEAEAGWRAVLALARVLGSGLLTFGLALPE